MQLNESANPGAQRRKIADAVTDLEHTVASLQSNVRDLRSTVADLAADTPAEDKTKAELEDELDGYGVDPDQLQGTGSGGNVLHADLVAAARLGRTGLEGAELVDAYHDERGDEGGD